MRIVGHSRYPNSPGSPAAVAPLVKELRRLPGHVFWPDDISLTEAETFDVSRLLTVGQVTDSYLLGLARARGGKLATFDERLIPNAVIEGARSLYLIS